MRNENGAVFAALEDGILGKIGRSVGEVFEGGGACRAGVSVACERIVGTQSDEVKLIGCHRPAVL